MRNIVNIINFVRAVEPRPGRDIDMKLPVVEQIRIMRENNLCGTFLLQYDALIDEGFQALMRDCRDFCEIGLWLEIVQPQVEAIGEVWRGRYPWDWYNDVGFLIGYEPDTRLRLIDEAMEKFREIWGGYPRSVGSWHIDAVSMKYLADKYNVDACCICRDQVGTDGYSMQGGYYNQAYYPSVNNMFCPASSAENQINMPVFRMLGSDQVYAYDYQQIDYGESSKRCPTLEPAQLGRYPAWCDWFFDETFSGNGLCFQYTQAGQENSFGWHKMGAGIEYQFSKLAAMRDEGKVEIITLGEAGMWYKNSFALTPSAALTAMRAWDSDRYKSVWFNSRYYRANIFWDGGVVRMRDLYIFDDRYEEHYLRRRCDLTVCEYRNLPVMDGAIYSNEDKGILAGIYFAENGEPIVWDSLTYSESEGASKVILSGALGRADILLCEESLTVRTDIEGLSLIPVCDKGKVFGNEFDDCEKFGNDNNRNLNMTFVTRIEAKENDICFTFGGFDYSVGVEKGSVGKALEISAEEGVIELSLNNKR